VAGAAGLGVAVGAGVGVGVAAATGAAASGITIPFPFIHPVDPVCMRLTLYQPPTGLRLVNASLSPWCTSSTTALEVFGYSRTLALTDFTTAEPTPGSSAPLLAEGEGEGADEAG